MLVKELLNTVAKKYSEGFRSSVYSSFGCERLYFVRGVEGGFNLYKVDVFVPIHSAANDE